MKRLLASALFLSLLAACAGTAPAPSSPENGPSSQASETTAPALEASAPAAATEQPSSESVTPSSAKSRPSGQQAAQQSTVMFNSQQLNNYRLSTPENIPGVETSSAQFGADQTGVPSMSQPSVSLPIDPYMAFPALVDEVFAFADSLYRAGYTDSASAYLERFRVI